jgi:molybdenum cofactor cytidylyltransferase
VPGRSQPHAWLDSGDERFRRRMISSIILAAGMSKRMGTPKALLDWGGEPLVSYQVRQLREAGVDEVVVVLGHQADEIHRGMRRADCRVMLNPRYQMGRAGSLRIGAKAANRDADAIVIMNVDQPRPADFLRQLISAHQQESAATLPTSGGQHGHPVVVSGRLRNELMEARDENEGLRGVLHAHEGELAEVLCDDLCQVDINTPDDYEAAKQRFGL